MPYLLGVDTGGTYTDAVIYDENHGPTETGIVAKAKAPTTPDDLAVGIGQAVDSVMKQAAIGSDEVALVSLSTTLATNSLVEGIGGQVCLLFIGFGPDDLERAGLATALDGNPVAFIAGGHNSFGAPDAELDLAAIDAAINAHGDAVDAYAVAAKFSVRNPEHELAAIERVRALTNRPVTGSHELSAKLNGPKRALTCVLNARLIAVVDRLCDAATVMLAERSIAAPLMLVRGDGSLVSVDFVRARPIETILSGPAASIVGAAHLTNEQNAVVSDIGGTTTDIARISDGQPAVTPDGATVGGHRTMVQAVDMVTHGLGGDSEVRLDVDRLQPALVLGPRRLIPVSMLALSEPQLVHDTLDRQVAAYPTREWDGRFLRAVPSALAAPDRTTREREILDATSDGWVAADKVLRTNVHKTSLRRLLRVGAVRVAGFTPSDAAHVLGLQDTWDVDAATKGATLLASLDDGRGSPIRPDAETLSRWVFDTVARRSAEVVLDLALASDGIQSPPAADSPIAQAALDGHTGATRVSVGVAVPLVALGAPAATYYSAVGKMLDCPLNVPADADVANAVGAVVGRVRLQRQATVAQPSKGQFRVHLPNAPHDYGDLYKAQDFARDDLIEQVRRDAEAAGARNVDITTDWTATTAMVEGKEVFVEGTMTAEAVGRPRLAGTNEEVNRD